MLSNLVFFAILKTTQPNYLRSLFTTVILNRQLMQNVQEELKIQTIPSFLLTFSYFNCLAIILGFIANEPHNDFTLFFLLILWSAMVLKWLVMIGISFVSQTKSGIQEHLYNHALFFQLGGLILTPFLIFTHFFPESWQYPISIGLAAIVVCLIFLREIQSLIRSLKARVNPLYIILYLCTLELLPLLLIIHALANNSEGIN
jgi:phosphate starvation-inducible membrane PsiE